MYIKKMKIVDNQVDPLKQSIGKRLVTRNNKLIEQPDNQRVRIRYGGVSYRNSNDGFYEAVQQFIITTPRPIPLPTTNISTHLSEIIVPAFINDIAINDDSKSVSSAYVKAKFNFVSEQYERFSNSKSEIELPCIYLENDPQQTKTIMDQKVFTRTIPKARDFYDFEYKLKPRYKGPNVDRTKNLLFGQDFSFNIGNAEKDQYPFYTNFRFNYHTKNEFKNALKTYNFFGHFLDDYMNSSKGTRQFKVQTTQIESSVETEFYDTFDALGWFAKSDFALDETNKMIFEPSQKYKSNYQYYLDKMAFAGKMRKFCKDKMQDIQKIHNNDSCETEVMFYKIDKLIDGSNTVLQSFWIPADDNYIDYVDTQVKYGVKYVYRVHAYVMIFGSTYRYELVRRTRGRMIVNAILRPSFQIVKFENIFSDYCRVVQPPQPVPTINFVNESNKEDYIKIHMNLSIHSEPFPLEVINNSETSQELLREDYDRLEERPRFVYNNERALYEIYRTNFIPEKWEDLQGYKVGEIRNSFPSTGAVYKDYIDAWTKYYYVVRCINFHGLVSNPTPIYEVEMTKDADESFLSVRSVPFSVPVSSQPTRTFMKLIQAIPATRHTFYDENKFLTELELDSGKPATSLKGLALNKLSLGSAEHPIWGKKFKFRITSKETGRKFDLNVKVNLIKKKTKENSK
tara:strand:+ start:930 stop:2975 length:2046 start_codon:yes stop_codon:yes gene_type:complete